MMSRPHFEAFFAQAIDEEKDKDTGLRMSSTVYTSWCLLNNEEPQPSAALWEALKAHNIMPGHNHVGMKGPAAADYIISSAPDLH